MGLLSDPEAGHSKWAHFLIKYHRPFCFLLCISAYVWFCLLAHKSFNNGNSYSENALLPGKITIIIAQISVLVEKKHFLN